MSIVERLNLEETIDGTKKDFKNSWQMLRQNYRAFLSTEIFAIFAFIFVMTIVISGVFLFFYFNPHLHPEDIRSDFELNMLSFIYRITAAILAFIVLSAFMYSQVGLAYDIMSSGDMYAEFKSSFSYFKKHWFHYSFLALILQGVNIFIMSFSGDEDGFKFGGPSRPSVMLGQISIVSVIIVIFLTLVSFLWFTLIVHSVPSVTAQGSLKNAFLESFRILRSDPKRVLLTWGVYFIIFFLPGIIIEYIISYYIISSGGFIFMMVLLVINILYHIFLGLPMMSLIATGIYNNVGFERILPAKEKEENEEKKKKEIENSNIK